MPRAITQPYNVPPLVEVLSKEIFVKQGFAWDTTIYWQSVDIYLAAEVHNWSDDEVIHRVQKLTGDPALAVHYLGLNIALALLSEYLEGHGVNVTSLSLTQAQNHYEVFVLKGHLDTLKSLDVASPAPFHPEDN